MTPFIAFNFFFPSSAAGERQTKNSYLLFVKLISCLFYESMEGLKAIFIFFYVVLETNKQVHEQTPAITLTLI